MRRTLAIVWVSMLAIGCGKGSSGSDDAGACPAGEQPCDGTCVDVSNDPAHCGACGSACEMGSVCSEGSCSTSCPAGQSECSGGCFDLQSSVSNCGGCRITCAEGWVCSMGRCQTSCDAPLTDCGGVCADLDNDPAHCGACSTVCPTSACVAGTCSPSCEAGRADCDLDAANGCEVDVASDLLSCGACGNACPLDQVCTESTCVPARSCAELFAVRPDTPDGTYAIDPDGAGGGAPFTVACNMTSHGGGWTLVGSMVNGTARAWDSLTVLTDATTFGDPSTPTTAPYKSPAWSALPASDLMIVTSEYDFGFTDLLGDASVGTYVSASWPAACSTTWTRAGVDFSAGLSTQQAQLVGFTLRALDDNSSDCFPGRNENAAIVFTASSCCWNNGLANTPAGYVDWIPNDHSVLRLANLVPLACTAGTWPCNENGYYHDRASNCYDASCKVPYVLVYVR